jgi:alkylated DNA repair dioxygenase AlkB
MPEIAAVPGLTFLPGYLTPAEHDATLACIDSAPWLTDLKRRVQHYGYRYNYKRRSVDSDLYLGTLPGWLVELGGRLVQDGLFEKMPDQVIVNEYAPGQGIALHIDCEPCFGNTIVSITLGSACVMNYVKSGQTVPILLHPRSLVRMCGEARYAWKHGIPARKFDQVGGQVITRARRVSVTFRNVIINRESA